MSSDSGKGRPLVGTVLAELRALSSELDRLDQLEAERYGLNRTDLHALEIVSRTGSLTPTELAQELRFTTGGVTTVIDRLERAGYVRRRPDGSDRRRVIVEATALTRRRDAEVFGALGSTSEELAASYSDKKLRVITDFLRRSRTAIAAQADALPRP
jgi:DNA-binding MarR family transcriptional regulator